MSRFSNAEQSEVRSFRAPSRADATSRPKKHDLQIVLPNSSGEHDPDSSYVRPKLPNTPRNTYD